MTLEQVIQTLDTFRDEYNASTDPDVKKLCNFVSCTIDSLNAYLRFFRYRKPQMEQNQQYYADSITTLNNMLGEDSTES